METLTSLKAKSENANRVYAQEMRILDEALMAGTISWEEYKTRKASVESAYYIALERFYVAVQAVQAL